jgi:hypothetical protein
MPLADDKPTYQRIKFGSRTTLGRKRSRLMGFDRDVDASTAEISVARGRKIPP